MLGSSNRLSVLAAALSSAVLAGCSGDMLSGLRTTHAPAAPGSKVEHAFAVALETADAGTTVNYRKPDGSEVVLTLAQPYTSAGGQDCRVGRDGKRWAYAFCRTGRDWQAVEPAQIVGQGAGQGASQSQSQSK
jgi:surface antigen